MRLFFKIIISRQTKCDNNDDKDLFLITMFSSHKIQQNVYAVFQSVNTSKQKK